MSRLLKYILGVIIILGVAYVGLSFAFGVWMEKHYQEMLTELPAHDWTYKVTDYQRGWFRSYATVEMSHVVGQDTLSIKVKQTIYNGPIVPFSVDNADVVLKWGIASLQGHSVTPGVGLQADALFTFSHTIQFYYVSDQMRFTLSDYLSWKDSPAVGLKGLVGFGTYNRQRRHVQYQATAEKLTVLKPGLSQAGGDSLMFVGHDLSASADVTWQTSAFWYGTTTFSMASLTSSGVPLSAKNIHWQSNMKPVDGDLTDLRWQLDVKHLTYKGEDWNNLVLKSAFTGLNSKALKEFLQSKLAVSQSVQQAQAARASVMSLLGHGATLKVQLLSMSGAKGALKGALNIEVPRQGDHPNILLLIAQTKADLDVTLPRSIVLDLLSESAAQRLHQKPNAQTALAAKNTFQSWKKQGLIKETGSGVHVSIRYAGGRLSVNGREPGLYKLWSPPVVKQVPVGEEAPQAGEVQKTQ